MINILNIENIAFETLTRLHDTDKGGFFYGFNSKSEINKLKLLRYNARIIDLLDINLHKELLYNTATYIIKNLQQPDGSLFFSSAKDKLASIGDVSLFVDAITKLNGVEASVILSRNWLDRNINHIRELESSQISWILPVIQDKSIINYLLNERKLKDKRFGLSYISFPTIIYTIHSLLKIELADYAYDLFKLLTKYMFSKQGEWKLAYFPFFKWSYSKPFSVHQLGMAPLCLLELYDIAKDEKILNAVLKGVKFGEKFIGKNRIYRTLHNKETRSYECAFDYVGLTKVKEYIGISG